MIASLPTGTRVVFDYADPPASLPPAARARHEARAVHVAELGEAWVSYFEPAALAARLGELGFSEIEDLGPPQIALRYFPTQADPLPDRGGHVILAGRGRS
jgi:O-methyltransferase involved in polyketide biosynthesis